MKNHSQNLAAIEFIFCGQVYKVELEIQSCLPGMRSLRVAVVIILVVGTVGTRDLQIYFKLTAKI